MSKRIRNILSLAVAFCMVFSLVVVNVSAAPSVPRTVTINLSANEGQPGDEITVELTIDSTANLSSLGYYLQLDPDVFEFDATVVSAGPGKTRLQCADAGWYSAAASGSIFLWAYLGAPQFGANPEAGTISVGGFAGVGVDPEYNEADALIGKFHLKVKADAPSGTSEITLFDASTLDYGADGGLPVDLIFTPVTFTVGGGVVTHTVTYDLNGGSGTVPTQDPVAEGAEFTIASAAGINPPADKQFKEWNTASDGSGTVYAPGATVTMGASDITLYAIWEDIPVTTFTLTIGDTTNGSITLDPTGGVYDEDTVVTVTAIPNAGYQFVQFTGASTSTDNPITVTMTSDMTIGAIFELIPSDEPTLAVSSAGDVAAGGTFTVDVIVQKAPASMQALNFVLEFDESIVEYVDIELFKLQENEVAEGTDAISVAAIVKDSETIADNDVIATVTFSVDASAAEGTYVITPINVYFNDEAVTRLFAGTYTVILPDDPNLPAALAAVSAYTSAPLTTLAEVAAAEALEQDAWDAIDALDPVISADEIVNLTAEVNAHKLVVAAAKERLEKEADAIAAVEAYEAGDLDTIAQIEAVEAKEAAAVEAVEALEDGALKTELEGRIADRREEVATARENLEKQQALDNINAGEATAADLAKVGVNLGAEPKSIATCNLAFAVAKLAKNSDLTVGELQSIIDAANSVSDDDLGYVETGNTGGIVFANDAKLVKDHALKRRTGLSMEDAVKEAIRADIDGNGKIEAFDITAILTMSANMNLNDR